MNYTVWGRLFQVFIISIVFISPTVLRGLSDAISVDNSSKNNEKNSLLWTENFQDALSLSKKTSKPMFVYFTGSDWCGWCESMDKEILSNPEFKRLVGDKFIFVKVDFPVHKTLDSHIKQQNEELKEKYDIRGFPTIVLLDPQEHKIAVLNYRQGGGKSYAQYLLKILEEQEQFQKGINDLEKQNQDDLQKFYLMARKQGMNSTCDKIIVVALNKGPSLFFSKEQYRILLSEGKIDDPNTKVVRKKLLDQDPNNEKLVHYDVAILEFAVYAEQVADSNNIDLALKPLKDYLSQFGNNDKENRWRIEMTISQVLQNKNQMKEAIYYAKASKEHAPDAVKVAIANSILDLEQDVNSATAMGP